MLGFYAAPHGQNQKVRWAVPLLLLGLLPVGGRGWSPESVVGRTCQVPVTNQRTYSIPQILLFAGGDASWMRVFLQGDPVNAITLENKSEPPSAGRFLAPTSSTELWFWIGVEGLGILCLAVVIWLLYRRQVRLSRQIHDARAGAQTDRSLASSPPYRVGDEQLRGLTSELVEVRERLNSIETRHETRLEGFATSVERTATGLSTLRDEVETLSGELRHRVQHLMSLQTSVEQLARKTLDAYFDDWKSTRLRLGLQEETERTLTEFSQQIEIQKIMQENRAIQQKILDKACIWFESMERWTADLRADDEGADLFPASFCQSFVEYCQRGQHLVGNLETSLLQFDLKTVHSDTGDALSFLDVVSGRSNQALSTGYRRRLEDRVRDLQANTPLFKKQWESLRGELLELLDQFYGRVASQSKRGTGEILQRLESNLHDALLRPKIQEIPIEVNHTVYDASLHEVLAGAHLTRPDLPENTVVGVERRGFFYEGKVLRRALVTLSTKGK